LRPGETIPPMRGDFLGVSFVHSKNQAVRSKFARLPFAVLQQQFSRRGNT
jgi:hypothetical protein